MHSSSHAVNETVVENIRIRTDHRSPGPRTTEVAPIPQPRGNRSGKGRRTCPQMRRVGRLKKIQGRMKLVISYHPCNRRRCEPCNNHRAWTDAQRFTKVLAARATETGGQVYVVDRTDRQQATEVVKYATRLGHLAVPIAKADGVTEIYTTMPRKDGITVDHTDDSVGLVRWIESALKCVPFYTEDSGAHCYVRPNKPMQEALNAEKEVHLPPPDEDDDDLPEARWVSELLLRRAEKLNLVTERDVWGRPIEITMPERDGSSAALDDWAWIYSEWETCPVKRTRRSA